MEERFSRLPQSLRERSRVTRLGSDVPALLAHPDWLSRAPVVIWLHGRTAHKELDPGRYLRWIRAGIAACAIDLPYHGDRADPTRQSPDHTMQLLELAIGEIDDVVAALADPAWNNAFDTDRIAIGGMSAGGMAVLRRLCDPHPFTFAAVEGTTGSFDAMPGYAARYDPAVIRELDPIRHLDTWRPIPLLAVHSEADRMVPVDGIREFIAALNARSGMDGGRDAAGLAHLHTWPETGAPEEHLGFGRYSNDSKNLQLRFFQEHFGLVEADSAKETG